MHSSSFQWLSIRLCLSVLVLAILSSCPVGPTDLSEDTGITIAIGDEINARTLGPPTDMVAAKYTITGIGPGAATFTAVTTGASVSKTGLTIGSWTIIVEASNAAGTVIGSGSGTAVVSNGVKTAVTIAVSPVPGTGKLSLAITWPVGQIAVPTINASLIPVLGTAQPIVFAIAGSGATYSNVALANGYYTLGFTLQDGGINVAGAVTVVRIVTGQTTSGTFTFTNVNTPAGTITVIIIDNMQNPLTVEVGGSTATMSLESTLHLTTQVPNYSGSVNFTWYVNGVRVGTGASYTYGAHKVGYYRIDVTAFSSDGTRTGSASTNVTVNPAGGPVAPELGTSGSYAVLAGTGIVIGAIPASVRGNIGLNAAAAGFGGFAQTLDLSGVFATSSLVTGKMYATDYSGTTPAALATAIADEQAAYAEAAGRTALAVIGLGAGELGGLTILPGLYKWTGAVSITTDVTLKGGPYDIWIFQVDGALALAASISIHLTGGANPRNIYWQTLGAVGLGANSNFAGTVLSNAAVGMGAGATMTGRLFSTTTVTLGAGSTLTQSTP